MLEKIFKFTAKDLIKLTIMLVVATLLFGLPGLLIILTFHWITQQSYAQDPASKHGISQLDASRLGGATVFGFSLILYVVAAIEGFIVSESVPSPPLAAWMTVIVCTVVGFIDDLFNNILGPKARLWSTIIVFGICLSFIPSLIPQNLGVPILDSMLALPILGLLIAVIFCVGFVNAINMADGANGLIPGTLTVTFIIFYLETGFIFYAILITTCGLFAIFNVISGRLFLGDAGTYGFGSLLVLNGLYLFSTETFSASFLAVLFAYPCLDMLFTVVRRFVRGNSILLPDDDHLHNRIHFHCQRWFRSKTVANSMTGLIIVSCSSGVALLGFNQQWWEVTSNQWIWVFIALCLAYCIAFIISGSNRSTPQ